MSKHTPGPWSYFSDLGRLIVRRKFDAEFHPDGQAQTRIAEILPCAYMEENAALIAAAPEMLEALKLAAQCCPCTIKERLSGHISDCFAPAVQQAIAKAEGKL